MYLHRNNAIVSEILLPLVAISRAQTALFVDTGINSGTREDGQIDYGKQST